MRKFKRCITTITAIAMVASAVMTSYVNAVSDANNNTENIGITSSPEVKADNSIGAMLLDSIETNSEESSNNETNYNYCISNLDFDNETGTVSVEYSSEITCTLLVGFYNDDGTQLITSVKSEVNPDLNNAELSVDTSVLTDNYLIKAYLLGLNQQPLADPFICDTYTEVKQSILEKTINDFDSECVINLDSDETNNFMVLNTDVILVNSDTDINILVSGNDETGVYTYSNISEEIASLQPGDIFYNIQNEDIIIVKVENVTVDGDTATITAADTSLEEVFEFVKIDTEVNNADDWSIDTSNLDENTTFNNSTGTASIADVFSSNKNSSGEHSLDFNFSYNFVDNEDDAAAELGLVIGIDITLNLEYDYSLFAGYLSVEFKTEISGSVELSGSGEAELSIPLGSYGASPVAGLYVQIEPKLVVRSEGEIAGKLTLSKEFGVSYDTDNGARDISSPAEINLSAEINNTVFAGFDLNPNVVLVSKKIAKAGITAEVGAEMVGTVTADTGIGTDTVHECDVCYSEEIYAVGRLGFEIEGIGGLIDFEGTLMEIKGWCNEMYWSVTYGDYGLGKCPHVKHKVTFIVSDENNNPINNAIIEYDSIKYTTDAYGEAGVYIPISDEGRLSCMVSADGYEQVTHYFTYEAEPKNVSIKLSEQKITTTSVTGTGTGTETLTTTTVTTTTTTPEDEDIASGTCGDNLTWVLDSNGVLTISGTGEINDDPWHEYSDSIVSVVIGDGVEKIWSESALNGFNVVEITVAEENEFYSSSDGVLFNKDKTELLAYPMGKEDKFYAIPDSVTTIGYQAFEDCTSLTSITISDNVTTIDSAAFTGCGSLTSITIPDSITTIGYHVFEGCTSLTSITIPDSVLTIGYSAFWECTNLTSITLPDSLTTIDPCAFYHCRSLSSITIPDSVTTIGDGAFSGCSSLTSITLPAGVTSIGQGAFSYCGNLIEIEVDEANEFYSSYDGVLFNKDKTEIILYPCCKWDECYVIPDSVTTIGYYAFWCCTELSITIPDSVTTIGEGAFCFCENLTSIPDSIISVGYRAFENTEWYHIQFDKIQESMNINESEYGIIYAGKVAYDCILSDENVPVEIDLDEGTKAITEYAFRDCTNLVSINIPNSVTSIGASAFEGCTSLTSITISDSLTTIGYQAFSDCTSLTSITIPDSVTTIGFSAFVDCTSLTSITIPDSVTTIGVSAFYGCDSLATASIPAHLADYIDVFPENTVVTIRDSESTEETTTTEEESPLLSSSNKSTVEDVTSQPETFTYNGKPNSTYIFIAVKEDNAEDLLSSENLLYINQKKSDENGDVLFEYVVDEECKYIFGGDLGNGGYCRTSGTLDIENETCTICGAGFGDISTVTTTTTTTTTTTITTTTTTVSSTTEKASETTVPEDTICLGDVNSDNAVNAVDASMVLSEYALIATGGTPLFTEGQSKAADVNFDGVTNAVDASSILSYYAYIATGGSGSIEEYLNINDIL